MTAPTLIAPVGGTVAVNEPLDLRWETEGSQTAAHVRMREQGSATWDVLDTGLITGADQTYLLAADTLTPAEFEWEVGVVSPTLYPSATSFPSPATFPSFTQPPAAQWSARAFFAGRLRPGPPVIDAPTVGETIDKARYLMRWTPADLPGVPQAQSRYRVRRRQLDGLVLGDTGEVIDVDPEHLVQLDNTDVNRLLDVQVFFDGLWSDWATRQVYVFFVGPPIPTVTVTPVGGVIVVAITNPPPGAEQPDVVVNEVHRRVVAQGGEGIRLAADVAPDGSFVDPFPVNRQVYAYRVGAVGTDGNFTFTDWQE